MNNSIKTSYLSLDGTNSSTNFSKDQPLDSDSHEGEVNVISGSSDVEVVNARRGRTGDSSKYLHYGALFWIQFN